MGASNRTIYLLVNGLKVGSSIDLAEDLQLQPAGLPKGMQPSDLRQPSMEELAIVTLFLPGVASQLEVVASTDKELAVAGWNALWEVALLSALLKADGVCNLFSTCPLEQVTDGAEISVSNRHLYGLRADTTNVAEPDISWLGRHYSSARTLMEEDRYQDAVAAVWSYRWHTRPRARMALLWAGIEGLLGVQSEVTFRVSLTLAWFLEPNERDRRLELFRRIKKLYSHRSRAVHGGKMKPSSVGAVEESADLLQSLLRECAERGELPDEMELVI